MNKLIYKGNLNDFKTFAGVGVTKGNWNERALKYFQYLGATSNSFNTAQKEIEEANLETLRLDFADQDYAVGSADTGAVETTETFDSLLTFTRGSTGTYFDSAGVLQTAAVDEPRFTHDPDTLEAEGLLIEEQRTNLFLQSEALGTTPWGALRAQVTSNAEIAPSNEMSAELVTQEVGQSSAGFINQTTPSTVTSTEVSFSVYIKRSNVDYVLLILYDNTSNGVRQWVNTSTQEVASSNTLGTGWSIISATTTNSIDGWFRVELCVSKPTSTDVRVNMYPSIVADLDANSTVEGSGNYFWGAQLEEGAFPTSYIKTEASQVTRSADNCSRTLGSEFNAEEFTFYYDYVEPRLSNVGGIFTDSLNYIAINSAASPGTVRVLVRVAGVFVLNKSLSVSSLPGRHKIAVSATPSGYSAAFDGVVQTGAEDLTPAASVGSLLLIGKEPQNNFYLNDTVHKTLLYPRALSATELQELTA